MSSKPVKKQRNQGILEVKDGTKTIAIFYSRKLRADEVSFLTPTDFPLQIGLLEQKTERTVPMHRHRDFKYNVNKTQELLYVEKGKVDVAVANNKWKVLEKKTLTAGDFVLFTGASHSVKLYAGSRVLEVKQGPYPGKKKSKIYK